MIKHPTPIPSGGLGSLFTHAFTVDYTDLTGTAATTKVLQLVSGVTVGHYVAAAAFELETPFDGGATSALKLDVGYDLAAGSDDPDAFLDNYELHLDGTEILGGDGNGAVFATLRTGYFFLEGAIIDCLFTATGANLSTLTTGRVHIYLALYDLKKLRLNS